MKNTQNFEKAYQSISLDPEFKARVLAVAKAERRTVNAIVTLALEDYVKRAEAFIKAVEAEKAAESKTLQHTTFDKLTVGDTFYFATGRDKAILATKTASDAYRFIDEHVDTNLRCQLGIEVLINVEQ